MPAHSLRFRIVVVAAILCIPLLLTGCDWYTGLASFLNNGDIPVGDAKPTRQADAPAPYCDAEDDAAAAQGEVSEAPLFDNQNVLAVQNGGTSPTFEAPSTATITKIGT